MNPTIAVFFTMLELSNSIKLVFGEISLTQAKRRTIVGIVFCIVFALMVCYCNFKPGKELIRFTIFTALAVVVTSVFIHAQCTLMRSLRKLQDQMDADVFKKEFDQIRV